jgi:hypothetical protein
MQTEEALLATHDDQVLREYLCAAAGEEELVARLARLQQHASEWKNELHLTALACSVESAPVAADDSKAAEAWCALCHKLASRENASVMKALFGSEKTRRLLLDYVERGKGVTRREASGAFVKLCLYCLKDKACDGVVCNFVRLLIVPVRRVLEDEKTDLQSVANVAQIVAARCASQSFDKTREPNEAVLFAEEGIFDRLGSRLAERALLGPLMNAIQGVMVAPQALEHIDMAGPLMEQLKKLRGTNKQAATIVDAVELVAFKRVVKEKAKEKGDGGKSMGNEFLGVLGAANGPQQMGFEFTNKDIEKGFKDLAFKEGVLKPMARKMEEEGERPLDVDSIAKSVLGDFTKPRPGCEVCSGEGVKRCGACKRAHYCSSEHQRQDWPRHKSTCNTE